MISISEIPFLTLVEPAPPTAAEAIADLNALLVARGLTRPDYALAVTEREQVFPTGLPTDPPVAIPHADPDFVNASSAVLGVFTRPVQFLEMGSPESKLDVRLVFLLALTQKEAAVPVLEQLTAIFRRSDDLYRLQNATTAEEAGAILKEMLARQEDKV